LHDEQALGKDRALVAADLKFVNFGKWAKGGRIMKRSRRVVLTMMGSAAAGAVSLGWIGAPNCGRNEILVQGLDGGRPYCRIRGTTYYGGFGGTLHHVHGHGHGGHGHAGGGG
jgi:hypothetical protein